MISLLDEERLKTLANLLDKVHKTPEEIDILKKEVWKKAMLITILWA